MALDAKAEAALALYRFGLGPRAGSIAAIASDPRGALLAELDAAGGAAGRTRRAAGRRRGCAAADAGSVRRAATGAGAQSGSRGAAADLSRGSQGAHRCRARRRDRLPGAARLVLVEPFLRVGG